MNGQTDEPVLGVGYTLSKNCAMHRAPSKVCTCGSRRPPDTVQSKQECGHDLRTQPLFLHNPSPPSLVCSKPSTKRDEKLDSILCRRRRVVQSLIWRKCDWSGKEARQGGPVLEHNIARSRSRPRCSRAECKRRPKFPLGFGQHRGLSVPPRHHFQCKLHSSY